MGTPLVESNVSKLTPRLTGRVVVLGGGAVVRECFVPALASLGLSERTTIVDARSPSEAFTPRLQVVSADFAEYLSTELPKDATHCVVALPNGLHYAAVIRALEAGLHVLCEKPLALTRRECSEMADVAKARDRVLAVNMVRRLFHSVQTSLEVLERGWLGELSSVQISHGGPYGWPVSSLAPFQTGNGGVLADMGVHYLDLAGMLVGPLEPVAYEDDFAGGVESDCRFRLRTGEGVQVDLTLSRLRPLPNEIRLVGSKGRLTFGVDAFNECRLERVDTMGAALTLRRQQDADWVFSDYFAEQLRRFLGASVEDQSGLVDGHSAARTAALLEWAYSTRRRIVSNRGGTATLGAGGVFISGATGFIGSHLVDRVAGQGSDDITAGYRSLPSCAEISRYPVRYHPTRLLDPDHVREAIRGRRYVFHLAYGKDSGQERAVTVQGTKNLVEACIAERVEAVVVLSTMYVLGQPGGIVDETAPYHPVGGVYGTTKAEMERWCLERARTSGSTRIVVLLPTCVYGPRGATYTTLPVQLARNGGFCWIDRGEGIANVVYVDNLVAAIVRAAITPEAHGHRFIINDESLTWREFLEPLLGPWAAAVPSPDAAEFRRMTVAPAGPGARDVARSILTSPQVWETVVRTRLANRLRPLVKKYLPSVSRMRSRVSATNDSLAGLPRLAPPAWLADVYGPSATKFSSAKAHRVLGWTPLSSLPEGVEETVSWLRRQGLYEPPAQR